jgi:hypothetical protein
MEVTSVNNGWNSHFETSYNLQNILEKKYGKTEEEMEKAIKEAGTG